MSPGDEVICSGVTTVCRCVGDSKDQFPEYREPEVGRHYIVGKVGESYCEGCGDLIPAMSPVGRAQLGCPPPFAWPQAWFRPLVVDEEEMIVRAGVTLPVRVGENA